MVRDFSMTPTGLLVISWKSLMGLVWVLAMYAASSVDSIDNELNPLFAALAVITASNFIMVLVLLITASLNKDVESFIEDAVLVGNSSLLSLAAGSLIFIAINSLVPIKISLVVVSMITSIIIAGSVIYTSTKLLNGNVFRVATKNMWSVIIQAGIMFAALFLIGY
ncbi:MAG: hypothetical protein A2388_02650 [Candidatus Veblenbacteria bacterium RIFOXYB1_FULL_43_13]|uniref:Yip1 domain-containing protein n=2 Tax=Candidatus Vebleniibacteriota TaxID=1817921 RepID=A0A1G2Q197_9BACT|nr:MAG: hypothetical protein A2388_02650 [Candidatus Veblenbacteria bacterium RIFOXYB1_FULL_43_13]